MYQNHNPVMKNECREFLITNKNGVYFDGTLGFGGHSSFFLSQLGADATLIATDVDLDAFGYCKNLFEEDKRVKLYNYNFTKIVAISKIEMLAGFDGIFVDLGVSSFQLDNKKSGFTYREESELDLRLDKTLPLNGSDVLNTFEQNEIADIFFKYGEERNSRRIAREIVEARKEKKIATTVDLTNILDKLTPPNFRIKTYSRIFQALRIYVNDELDVLRKFLTASVKLLNPGGRLVVLSYHSLEDKVVKEVFQAEAKGCICPTDFPICACGRTPAVKIITRKAIQPSAAEVQENNRSRSAQLRVAEKI